ncbi:MAG: S-layer homology domain-containing protein, partial [Bacillota bacterium]|nr:S-layer homology domain-containing protein [Bacillota bacterium]
MNLHLRSFRPVAALAVLALLAAPALPGGSVHAAPFSDVGAGFWASEDIQAGASFGFMNGYPDGSFKPNATVTRAEFAAMLVRALGLPA